MTAVDDERSIHALVAAENTVCQHGVMRMLAASRQIGLVEQAASGADALDKARWRQPDVVVLGLQLPPYHGIDALPDLAKLAPVLVLTARADPSFIDWVLGAGATSYLVQGEFDASAASRREVRMAD